MALPSSGPISGSQIATELGASSTNISLRSLSSTAGKSSPDAMSEFHGYSIGYLLATISPSGTGTTYQTYSSTIPTSFVGQSKRLVFHYVSGNGEYGDFQVSTINFGTSSYYFNNSSHRALLQTSRSGESSYHGVTWYSLGYNTSDALRWNYRYGTTPTTGTGIDTSGYDLSYYVYIGTYNGYPRFYHVQYTAPPYYFAYAETSGNGHSYKNFWLRTPAQTIGSSTYARTIDFYYAGYGSTMGTLKVYLI